jgi:hypothetical protein
LPSARCHPETSTWPGWNTGSPAPSRRGQTPTSGSCCTITPAGTSSVGCAGGWPAPTPPAVSPPLREATSARPSSCSTGSPPAASPSPPPARETLEAWLASPEAIHRDSAGNFVRWARRQKLTRLDFAAVKWGGPTGVIDIETRWEQARWLLHDDTVKPEDRAAGLLVLLYAQTATRIVRLTLDHVHTSGTEVHLRLGREPVVLPEPLAGLVRQVAATRKGHATIGHPGASPWLFPGGGPGRALSAFRMTERLNQLGIHVGQSRSAALFQLATDLPAAVLAEMLGIHITVAVAWQRASAGDWAAYAAEVSRRPER